MLLNTRFVFEICILTIIISITFGKIYDRCELASELRNVHEIPDNQLATWVCIARHESEFNTSARNHDSGDHGLFQISQLFWCSPPGYACGVTCEDLRNEVIEDDIICARRIYREHKRLSGDGFNAWVVYGLYCRDKQYASSFLDGCFPDGLKTVTDRGETQTKPLPTINYYPQFTRKTTIATTRATTITTAGTTTTPRTTTTKFLKRITTTASVKGTTRRDKAIPTTTTRKSPTLTRKSTTSKAIRPLITTTTRTTSKLLPTKKIDSLLIVSGSRKDKLLKATEENDEFTYAISKTGYKFARF